MCSNYNCSYTCEDLLFVQVCDDSIPLHCSSVQGRNNFPIVQCCSAKQAQKICSPYRCVVIQYHCTAAVFRAEITSPLSCVALQNRLRTCLWHCNHTYEDLSPFQVCSDSTPLHCSSVQGRNNFPTVQCCSAKQDQNMPVSLQLHL